MSIGVSLLFRILNSESNQPQEIATEHLTSTRRNLALILLFAYSWILLPLSMAICETIIPLPRHPRHTRRLRP
jgi:hypothetical protein